MTKKINPILFKLGVKNQWNSHFYEKKMQESGIFSFISVQLENFFKLVLKSHGFHLTDDIAQQEMIIRVEMSIYQDSDKIWEEKDFQQIAPELTSHYIFRLFF